MATASSDTAEGKAVDQFKFTVNHETITWTLGRLEGSGTGSSGQSGSGSFPCPLPEVGARSGTFTIDLTDTVTEIILYASSVPVFKYKGTASPSIRGSWKGTWKVRSAVSESA